MRCKFTGNVKTTDRGAGHIISQKRAIICHAGLNLMVRMGDVLPLPLNTNKRGTATASTKRLEMTEEVVMQQSGKPHKQVRVQRLAAEDIIDIAAVAGQLLRQPCHTPSLTMELILNDMSDMHFLRHKKSVEFLAVAVRLRGIRRTY